MAEPECCNTPMVHNSWTDEWECADAYFALVDAGVFSDGESFEHSGSWTVREFVALRKLHEHWRTSFVPDQFVSNP